MGSLHPSFTHSFTHQHIYASSHPINQPFIHPLIHASACVYEVFVDVDFTAPVLGIVLYTGEKYE